MEIADLYYKIRQSQVDSKGILVARVKYYLNQLFVKFFLDSFSNGVSEANYIII